MEIVTLREFARRVGVSLTAVQAGVKNGRVTAIKDPETGTSTGIDWSTQEAAWHDNAKHPQKRPNTLAGGRPRNDGAPPAPPQQRSSPPVPPPPPPGGDQPMSLAEIQRARELVKLQIDNEKLKNVKGLSVSAADVETQGKTLASAVIGALYVIPDRISDELAGMNDPNEIHALLLRELDQAVMDLRAKYAN